MQILKKVFVKVDESGMMPSVIYVELWGRDVLTDKEVYEKLSKIKLNLHEISDNENI